LWQAAAVIPEAPLERTEHGLVAQGDGWFVVNARDARWYHAEGRSAFCDFEGDQEWVQVGVNVQVLWPGQPMSMYHWEADQEDFLVVSGEALLIVEGQERPLRPWDFVHCPPNAEHTIVGAGDGPCIVVAVGAREHQGGEGWGGYRVDETALGHGAGVETETTDAREAYAPFNRRRPASYQDDWLPE
jgi:quercetin dioxygenase-like cupin family protein